MCLIYVLMGVYLTIGIFVTVTSAKSNRLKTDLIEDLLKQNELLAEQNKLLRSIIKKYGLDISE